MDPLSPFGLARLVCCLYERFRLPNTQVRGLNREILDHASIQAITCPSAHVASALAAALVLLYLQPWIGLLFLWVAVSIAVATIVGGYHYVADVLSAAIDSYSGLHDCVLHLIRIDAGLV
jgi:membrane-associated phospholipid phosphatase